MMAVFFNGVLTAALLAAAVYAQVRMPHHTATRTQATVGRLVLFVLGVILGSLTVVWRPDSPPWWQVMAFLGAFGVVHVPAAFILWSKRLRGVYR